MSIEGFEEEIAEELRNRARAFLAEQEERDTARRRELDVADEIAALPGMTAAMLVTLGEGGIKTLDDLADLSTDELIGLGATEDQERGLLADFGLTEVQGQRIDHGGSSALV